MEEIDRFAEGIEDYQEFCVHLQFLSKILGDYEKADKLEDPKAKLIFETYSYLKNHLKSRFPEIYAEYRAKIEDYLEKSSKKQARPSCVECGSKQLVSRGAEWQCKKCYRRFTKRRRN